MKKFEGIRFLHSAHLSVVFIASHSQGHILNAFNPGQNVRDTVLFSIKIGIQFTPLSPLDNAACHVSINGEVI